jgi:hypothetical protein
MENWARRLAWESGLAKVDPSTDYADCTDSFPNQVLARTVLQQTNDLLFSWQQFLKLGEFSGREGDPVHAWFSLQNHVEI